MGRVEVRGGVVWGGIGVGDSIYVDRAVIVNAPTSQKQARNTYFLGGCFPTSRLRFSPSEVGNWRF